MIALAAATTAMFSFGDFTSTGFENSPYVAGEVLDTQKDDAGLVYGQSGFAKVWEGYDAGTNASTVVKAYDNDAPVIDGKTAGSNYLYVETDEAPVTRYVKEGADVATIGSNGVYLDTLVKFTPMDAEDDASLATTEGDKIAIALVGDETAGTTNFVVRAGYVEGSSITPTNYTMNAVAENFDHSAWHRLIVEAISDVGNENAPVGFVVYVDGTMLTYSTDVAAGDAAYVESFNGVVKENLYTSSKHALLPSLALKGSNNYGALTSVSFKGQGSVDDIEFTATRPTVLPDFGTIVTIAWDVGVETVKIGDDEAFATVGLDYTATNITVAAGVTSLAVTATPADGKEIGEWTASEGTFADGTWTGFASGATLTINSMTPLFKVGDKNFGDFTAALAEAVKAAEQSGSPATIQLLDDIDGAISFTEGNIILDLNGKTIQGGDSDLYSINNNGAELTIIDSATGGTVERPTNTSAEGAFYTDDGTTTITAGTFEDVVYTEKLQNPEAPGDIVVAGGVFADSEYETEGFYLEAYVQEGLTATYANGYVTVSSGVTPEPTEIDVPTAVSGLVYDGTVLTGVAEGEGYTLSGNTATDAGNYTATATLAAGYVWTGGSTEAQTINWSIAPDANAEVTVTLTSEIAEYSAQLKFPTASATIGGNDVAGTPAWDPATISEPQAGATNTYTVTFTVTTANYVGSKGTATFKVWKAASSGDEYPIYIDPSDTETKAKYDTWKETYGADTGSAHEDAFLLNCAPTAEAVAAAKANFKATITVNADGTVTVTAPGNYNVTPTIQGKQTLSNTEEWHPKAEGDKFFRAVLSL